MAVLFLLSALVQFNDPAPAAWIVVYGAASVLTGMAAAGRPPRPWAMGLAIVCLAWNVRYIAVGAWRVPFMDLTREWHMTNEAIVLGREFYALLWLTTALLLVWRLPVHKPSATHPA